MLCLSPFLLSDAQIGIFTSVTKSFHQPPLIKIFKFSHARHHRISPLPMFSIKSAVAVLESQDREGDKEEVDEEQQQEQSKIKWVEVGSDITEAQKQTISQLHPKMTKRCKALMKQVICFSPQEGNLPLLLTAWVKIMKPNRADWLSVLKELQRLENPLVMEVMEHALSEDSFEANIRDYTKIIDAFAKQNRLHDAENAFLAMKRRGFTCDQVTLTVLVHMYSKAGDLNRAKETFEEIKLLGLPLDKRAYGSMIMAYIRAGMPEHGETLLKEMSDQEIYAGKEVYKALLRACSTIGDASGAQRVFDAVQLAGIVPDVKLSALLINAYCVAGRIDEARVVLENMKIAGIKPNDKCIALILAAYEKENKLEKAMALLLDLEKDGMVFGKEVLEVLGQWFGRLGVADDLEHVLHEFSNKRVRNKVPTF